MTKNIPYWLVIVALGLVASCAKKPAQTTAEPYSPDQVMAESAARLADLEMQISELEQQLQQPDSSADAATMQVQLDSLRQVQALERTNYDLKAKSLGKPAYDPSKNAQRLYNTNQNRAQEDRALDRKPQPYLEFQ